MSAIIAFVLNNRTMTITRTIMQAYDFLLSAIIVLILQIYTNN